MKNGCCGKGGCFGACLATILVVIGALNWGLVGIGNLAGGDWNVVHWIFQSIPVVENIIYILVGLAGLSICFGGCRCKKCKASYQTEKPAGTMPGPQS
jgi:hypothetical protein